MRILKLLFVFWRYFGWDRKDTRGERIFCVCKTMGTVFIKLGQILSMRPDLLPKGDRETLKNLLDNVNPLSSTVIRELLETNYATSVEEVFEIFEWKPIASASMSQVHRATLKSGEDVAVKILRPDICQFVQRELRWIKKMGHFVELMVPCVRKFQISKVLAELEQWLVAECDFSQEVQNMKELKKQYDFATRKWALGVGKVHFPKPFESLCSDSVIVMDFLPGVPLKNAEQVQFDCNFDIEKSIQTFVRAGTRALFIQDEYTFQADPHLANWLLLPNGDIGCVDFGLVAKFSAPQTVLCRELFLSIYLQDTEQVLSTMLALTGEDSAEMADKIRPEVQIFIEQASEKGLGFWFFELAIILLNHGIEFPENFISYGRCNLVMDGLIAELCPGKHLVDLLREEFLRELLLGTVSQISKKDVVPLTQFAFKNLDRVPRAISGVAMNPNEWGSAFESECKWWFRGVRQQMRNI